MKKFVAWMTLGIMLGTGALAERIDYEQPVTLPCATEVGGVTTDTEIRSASILGMTEEGQYAIIINGKICYVDSAALIETLDDVQITTDGLLTDSAGIQAKAYTDKGLNLQTALLKLGYIEDAPDGYFGKNSLKALNAYEAANEMTKTKKQEEITNYEYGIIVAAAGTDLDVKTVEAKITTADVKFAPIYGNCAFDLEAFTDKKFVFSYDDMTDKGEISLRDGQSWDVGDDSKLNAMNIGANIKIFIEKNRNGVYEGRPCIEITTTGARGLYVQSMILKSGDARCEIAVESVERKAEGSGVVETAIFPIDDAAANVLNEYSVNGTAKIRLTGKYREYDLELASPMSGMEEMLQAVAD